MSQHHQRSKHTSKAPKVRAAIEARLPAPCVAGCGNPVMPGTTWHVAHIIPASQGGQTTIANCGPAHASCNLADGGRLGAAITNQTRRDAQGLRPW